MNFLQFLQKTDSIGTALKAMEEITPSELDTETFSLYCNAAYHIYLDLSGTSPEYMTKAKEILDVHEGWVIKTPRCQMHGSSLRWWETQWEGDADGPAICAGHGWSIWRAEADYLYYALTRDDNYRVKAENSYIYLETAMSQAEAYQRRIRNGWYD